MAVRPMCGSSASHTFGNCFISVGTHSCGRPYSRDQRAQLARHQRWSFMRFARSNAQIVARTRSGCGVSPTLSQPLTIQW